MCDFYFMTLSERGTLASTEGYVIAERSERCIPALDVPLRLTLRRVNYVRRTGEAGVKPESSFA